MFNSSKELKGADEKPLDVLQDELPRGVVREVVGLEELAVEEGLQVLDLQVLGFVQDVALGDLDHVGLGAVPARHT